MKYLLISLLILFGCNKKSEVVPEIKDNTAVSIVMMTDYSFYPDVITIKKGSVIVWLNSGITQHNINLGNKVTEYIKPDHYRIMVFDKEGEYNYHCDPHVGMGMKGKIIVK